MQPVRTAIIGLGYWGPNLLRNFTTQPLCEMVWGCDMKQENLDKAKKIYPALQYTTNLDDVLADPLVELVLIATPTSSHFQLAKRVLEANKHVFVEKPITSTVHEADVLVTLADQQKKHLFVDHTFMFAPAVEMIANMAKNQELGKLLYFDSVRINLGLIQKDVNALWDLAIHDLSILSTFTNLHDIQTVCAHGSAHFGEQEEDVHLHLTYNNGFTAHMHVSWLSPVKIRRTILAGQGSMLVYDDTEPSEKLRIYDRGIEQDTSKADPFFPKYRAGDIRIPTLANEEPLGREAQNVLKAVRGLEPARSTGKGASAIIRILEKAELSMRNGSSTLPIV